MDYHFDQLINRRGTGSYKWDEATADNVIPLWVADMDFHVAPAIEEALRRRVEHGIFGYTLVPDRYYEAVISWFARRHHWTLQRDWIQYTSGVVPALSAIIKALTLPGDEVIVQTPVYNCFFSSIRNNGCTIVESLLLYNKDKRQPDYTIDFDDLERKAASEKARLLLLCNPHNPAGRVWTPAELSRVNDICRRHGVRVVADEIHCELTFEGHDYTPFASVSDDCLRNSITCSSPSKAFNTAGLQIANIICTDAGIRERIGRAININEVCDVNPFGVEALIAAYNDSEDWLDALRRYLEDNYRMLCGFFSQHLPHLKVTRMEGTYLAWIDCSSLGKTSDCLTRKLLDQGRVMVNSGTMYGAAGEGFIRINMACPQSRLREGLQRMLPLLRQD